MMNRPAPLAPELVLQEEEHQKIIEKRRQNSKVGKNYESIELTRVFYSL